MESFENRENKVFDFMNKVKETKQQEAEDQAFKNSTDYKLKCLDKEQDKAKGVCLDMIFSKIYKNALPLNDDYKVAHGEDLDAEMHDFINDRCPKGMEYYVREAIRKGNKVPQKIMESVDMLVDNMYFEKGNMIEEIDPKDLVFNNDKDTQTKINIINQDLGLDDISQIIRDNVKSSAISEITRAKQEKEDIKNLESELANDMNVTSESAIDHILELKGFTEKKTFEPSLFQGIMIGKLNQLEKMQESGNFEPDYLYNTLYEYGMEKKDDSANTIEEMAFVESVKELTKLYTLKALRLENFTTQHVKDLANEYAYN